MKTALSNTSSLSVGGRSSGGGGPGIVAGCGWPGGLHARRVGLTGVGRQSHPAAARSSGDKPAADASCDSDGPSVPNVTGEFAALAVGPVGAWHAAPNRAQTNRRGAITFRRGADIHPPYDEARGALTASEIALTTFTSNRRNPPIGSEGALHCLA
jgi:hypothetical protein